MEARIAEFLAGELEDRSGAEAHLVACAECRAQFSIARAGWEGAGEWKAENPSGDAIASTLSALQPVEQPKALLRVLQVGTLAASLVTAFVIGTSKRDTTPSQTPTAATKPIASTGLASLRPSVGMLFVQDEEGLPAGELAIRRLSVKVDIQDGIARTEIEETFQNRTDRRLEGTFQFPLPPDASISRLAMEIDGKLMEGEVVERQKARQTYEGIVRSMKDPALLEWMPGGLFQCRIFPIEPRSDKRIVIAYTQALSVFDGRARYVYPLAGESAQELGIGRFEFAATIRSGAKIVKAASTSHDAPTIRLNDHAMRTTFAFSDFRPRTDFVVAFETAPPDEVQVSAHRPGGAEPGYFAAFITPRLDREEELRRDRRLFFLIDASGSFARAELEAARLVIRRMIATLGPADRFRIGSHNLMVGAMAESVAPDETGRRAADRYLSELAAAGASDVATSLETTLSHYMADHGELVYVGEGTPTWGEKDPAKIVARLRAAMGAWRISIRTVAVGSDAEKGLLETISREFNGGTHAINPGDDVAGRADEIARTLGRSAVSQVKAEFVGAVTDAAPGVLGSLHFGERLLVTGRYGAGAAKLILTGKVHDRAIRREFTLALPEREEGNLHVKRLWAQRRLADLVSQGEAKRDETVKLSVEHQVMTPFTSFLVLENEKAYEEHRIERTKKAADQQNDPAKKLAAHAARQQDYQALLAKAQQHFEREQYDQCIDACDRILALDPRIHVIEEMKMCAQRLGQVKADRDLTQLYLEQWKGAWTKALAVDVNGPVRAGSPEELRNRKPKGLLGAEDANEEAADSHYRTAIRFYDSGEFEKAELECQKALGLNSNHGAAQALMLEVHFALGKGRVTPQSLEFDSIIKTASARQQQVVFETREALDNGIRAFNQGKSGEAERHFKTIIEYAKWLPAGDEIEAQRRQAEEFLGRLNVAPGPGGSSPSIPPAQGPGAGQDRQRDEMRVQIERAHLDITSLIREGDRRRAAGDFDTALRQFEEAEFKIRSIPYNLKTMKDLLPRVQEYVRRTRESGLDAQRKRDENQRALAGSEAAAYERARKREILETIHHFLEQAYMAFDQKRFEKCINLCDEIIAIDPHYAVAVELKEDVQKIRHREEYYDFLQAKVENWKKLTNRDGAVIPYADSVVFPSAEEWLEISKRSTSFAGLQASPGSHTVLNELRRRAWMTGKLIEEGDGTRIVGALSLDNISPAFSTLLGQDFATFLDPDGGAGPLAVGPTPNGGLALSVGNGNSGSAMAGVSYSLEESSAEDLLAAALRGPAVLPPSVFGVNVSVSIPGSPTETLLRLVEGQTTPRLQRPSGGYDIGGVGFTDVDEGKRRTGKREESVEQLSVQLIQREAELSNLEEARKRTSAKAFNQASTPDQARAFDRQEAERLSKELGDLETQYQELARDRQRLQESIAALNAVGVQTDRIAPRKALSAQVTAVSTELDLVVISIGRDSGVNEGDEFTIYRGNVFIAKMTVDRVDRPWASGRVTLKNKDEPRVGDTASNNVLATPGKAGDVQVVTPPPARKVRAITGDEVTLTGVALKKGGVYVLSRDWKYVATVEVVEIGDAAAKTRVVNRLRALPILEGDLALPVHTASDLWKVLPDTIRKDLLSDRCLAETRLKMFLLRSKGGAR